MSGDRKAAALISCSEHYQHRLAVIDKCLQQRGYDTIYITSDFDHTTKNVFTCSVPNCVQLHARPYQKNLSLDRILSHREFAKNVFDYLEKQPRIPDVVVALIPPNFLAHYGAIFKKRHPEVTMIFDIFDMWPETFPSSKVKKVLAPVFSVWAWIRDHSLRKADFVTTECELFRRMLNLPEKTSASIYLAAEPLPIPAIPIQLRQDGLDLCYLGAINNIIGISEICSLLSQLTKYRHVTLHIIGKGEREKEFIESAKAAGAQVVFYGPIFDDTKKQEIMSRCHFGLNIMKSSVCIGLTMKSVDFFRFGLPIINNIPADTHRLVVENGVGIQLDEGCVKDILAMSTTDFLRMRANVQRFFFDVLQMDAVLSKYHDLFDDILK